MQSLAAVVENGLVINMIIVPLEEDGTTEFSVEGWDIALLPEDTKVSMGWSYANGEFTAPPEPEESE